MCRVRAVMPGTLMALCQAPFTSLTTSGSSSDELSMYHPPALQLPAEPHDTELICAKMCRVRAFMRGPLMALCQAPSTSLPTSGSSSAELSMYPPPALQLPAEPHDTELICA